MRQCGKCNPTYLIDIIVLRVEVGDYIHGMVKPLVVLRRVLPFPKNLDQSKPKSIGAEMLIAE